MFRSIRWRIAIPYIVLTLLIMLILGMTLSYIVRQDQLANLENSLEAQAYLVSDALTNIIEYDSPTTEDPDQVSLRF